MPTKIPLNLLNFLSNLLVIEVKDIDFIKYKIRHQLITINVSKLQAQNLGIGKAQSPLDTTFGSNKRELRYPQNKSPVTTVPGKKSYFQHYKVW